MRSSSKRKWTIHLKQDHKHKLIYIKQQQLKTLTAEAKILEKDRRGNKVLLLTNGHILKIFTSRSRLSKSWWLPYSIKFARNAEALRQRSIASVKVLSIYKLQEPGKTAVEYRPLPGNTLENCIKMHDDKVSLCKSLGQFIAELHSKGIYFRALHPGNILLDEKGRWGLIDIADLRCFNSSLNQNKRERNFHHLVRHQRFLPYLKLLKGDKLISSYYQSIDHINESNLYNNLMQIWHDYLGPND
mgnify:CR=1 FL=1